MFIVSFTSPYCVVFAQMCLKIREHSLLSLSVQQQFSRIKISTVSIKLSLLIARPSRPTQSSPCPAVCPRWPWSRPASTPSQSRRRPPPPSPHDRSWPWTPPSWSDSRPRSRAPRCWPCRGRGCAAPPLRTSPGAGWSCRSICAVPDPVQGVPE